MTILVGDFVCLRPLAISDASLTLKWRESERARLLNAVSSCLENQKNWIANRPPNEYNFIIETKAGVPIGMISLIGIDHKNCHAETGRFLIGDEEAAKGIPAAVEAMKLIYEFAFDQLGLVRIHGTVAAANLKMIKWQKYLGMREEGRMRSHYKINEEWQDAVVFGLLAQEAREISIPRMNVLIGAAKKQLKNGMK